MAGEKSVGKSVTESACSICCLLPLVRPTQIIAIGVILNRSDENCSNPIRYSLLRQWLIVWAVVSSFSSLVLLLQRILVASGVTSKAVLIICYILGGLCALFAVAWVIVGSVWLYTADGCQDGKT